MTDKRKQRRQQNRKGLRANYGNATPEQVAEAVLRWNPNGPNRVQPARKPSPSVNQGL